MIFAGYKQIRRFAFILALDATVARANLPGVFVCYYLDIRNTTILDVHRKPLVIFVLQQQLFIMGFPALKHICTFVVKSFNLCVS